jgi:hypothetical protein
MNAISREPAKAMLRDGQLFQLNGTLRFPKCLSVAQAREVAYLFGRDFEDKTSAVPVMAPLPVNGGVGVHTADLAAWLDTLPDTEQSLCFELAGFSTLHGLHPESADEMLYSDTLTPDQRTWLTDFIARWNTTMDAADDAHTAAIEAAINPKPAAGVLAVLQSEADRTGVIALHEARAAVAKLIEAARMAQSGTGDWRGALDSALDDCGGA